MCPMLVLGAAAEQPDEAPAHGTALVPDVEYLGQLSATVDKKKTLSPLDEAGNFYLENVPPGTYSAEVQYEAGVCTLQLEVSATSMALVNIGTITCIVPGKETK